MDPEEAERLQRIECWDSLRNWFEERGYFLYEVVDDGVMKRSLAQPTREYVAKPDPTLTLDDKSKGHWRSQSPIPDDYFVEDPFPYAFVGPSQNNREWPPYTFLGHLGGKVMYAQDSMGRHLVIKKVKGGSHEYNILRLLKSLPRLRDCDSFPSVVPILDLLPYNDDWFLVMPRWEEKKVQHAFFPTFHAAFHYIMSLLEGLAFLHEHRIFHKDIADRNILVNHFSSFASFVLQSLKSHRYLQSSGAVKYAITDFDVAMLLDEKTYGTNPRLPIEKAFVGSMSPPYEVMHAYVDFDPFKYDVACLGIHFAENFQHIIVDVPLLAPFIDRMVTPDINARFTALEAIAFARTILPTISSLSLVKRPQELGVPYYDSDRWAGLPDEFIEQWGSYRLNISSWHMRFLNSMFVDGTERQWYAVYYCRYAVCILTFVPRFVFGRLLSPFIPRFIFDRLLSPFKDLIPIL